ncbi:NAD-dependent epimerase/dehydratase family protein [Erythrobacter litoralis]|uniref:Putative dihydroflavonol-4-reductase n=1 Tax=Erythrobacter litoralis (strain HTCC2594) TaxID=314225 RepID=Q2NB72_ERYLH|nr:NAD-dependent epimerase/dehydratase family protein [Erythrobacter litoralis]ABC63069.1 putative dihydroflavonol-4-reductase [Erythrobacter litoralis HTCC2594]
MAGAVLVTGGTGYIGGELIKQLLAKGWTVHTTIRDTAKSEVRLFDRFGQPPADKLKVFQAELLSDDGWAEAVAGCTHVAHVASPVSDTTPDDEDELIVPAREGTLRARRFARQAGVQRFVHTSSIAAVAYGRGGKEYTSTEADWTDVNSPDTTAYAKSKTIAERTARDWIAAEGAKDGKSTEYVSINPVLVLGPVDSNDFSASVTPVTMLLTGKVPMAPDIGFGVVDLRDVADLHVRCLEAPGINGERFIASGKFMKMIDLANVMRRGLTKEQAKKLPKRSMPGWVASLFMLINPPFRSVKNELGRVRHSDASHAEEVLGWKTRPEEDSILDCARSLFEHGVVKV